MDILLLLPVELQTHVLTLIPGSDLDNLFGLQKLIRASCGPQDCDPYTQLCYQAIYAKHHNRNLIMLNHKEFETLSILELEFLISHDILIAPREITFVLFDFTDYDSSISFMYSIFEKYFSSLTRFTKSFLIQLLLTNDIPLENSLLKLLFEPLCSGEFNVNWFTIKYHTAVHRSNAKDTVDDVGNLLRFSVADFLQPGREIAVSNLKLHLFNTSSYLKHFVDESGCFYCQNLQSLDLSFNSLTDAALQEFHFPELLEHLNLSNNLLTDIRTSSFPHIALTNLKSLNLSNNNIMRFDLRDTPNSPRYQYRLESLNLAGNILNSYSNMFDCLFFAKLKHVDISKNMLDHLSPFPPLLVSIDVSGNYLSFGASELMNKFPAGLHRLAISAPVPDEEWFDNFTRHLVHNAGLNNLRILEICGVDREVPFEM